MPKHVWDNDLIQFARLIAELETVGAFADRNLLTRVCVEMDLTPRDVGELVDRAQAVWDAQKAGLAARARGDVTPEEVLIEFCKDIEDTGGVKLDAGGSGCVVPLADDTWIDIGETYLKACEVLNRDPLYKKDEEDDDNESDEPG